ncbi:MAG: hypothetical protein WBQ50_06510 [Nocardioides sp.]
MFGRAKTKDDTAISHDTLSSEDGSYDTRVVPADAEQARRDRFGGINWGAGFFGWLVAVAVSLLLAGIIGGVGAGTGADQELLPTASTAEIGLVAILTLTVVLFIGYYAGGYVAGRMSRFDGPRQGVGVWVIGLLVTLITVGTGAFFGDQYDVLSQIDMPAVPLSTEDMTTGGLALAGVVLLSTLIAAMLGGGVGRHYHAKVDRAA